MDNEDAVPFESFGGVDCGEDQEVIIEEWVCGEVLSGGGRVECDFGQEAGSVVVSGGELFELFEVTDPGGGVVVPAFEDGRVELANEVELCRDVVWVGTILFFGILVGESF